MIGTKLAHYEVTKHLGTGGMGEVYQATDSKLGRRVAIKLLPAAVASDAERLSRFRREAQVLASLNHPNVAQIYGIEESGETRCIVMELVEGETLQARIRKGPIPVEESLTIAKQIAEALEAAHEKGIVHRDLKPGNVMLTGDGRIKVLDFGLAKSFESGGSDAAMSNSPTMASVGATNAGVILGTAAYMSPEQAKGRTVDRRTDIFAFGCVLFEMLSGKPAFEGADVTDILGAVLRMEPDWTQLPAGLPPPVRKLLRLCLEKDVRKRRRDAGDVLIDVDQALTEPSATVVTPARRGSLMGWIAFAVALLAAVVLALPAWRYLRETAPAETRLDIITPVTDQPASFALSPDGQQIVFVASGDGASRLWLRSLATTAAQPLAGTEGATHPFWSPNNQSIGFFAGGQLKRLDIGGGAPQTLAPATNGGGGTWNADGVIVFAPSLTSPLLRVSATGGAATAVTKLSPNQFGNWSPHFLPDGKRLLFQAGGAPDAIGIYLTDLEGGTPTRLAPDPSSAVYAPSGWLLWVRAGALIGQRLDVSRAALTGEPVTLADGVPIDGSGRSAVAVAARGPVAYRTAGGTQRQLTWFDRSGMTRGTAGNPDDTVSQPRLSPDGRRVVVVRTLSGNTDLWLRDGARTSRFTFDPSQDGFPVWSPDSTRIVFMSRVSGIGDLYQKLTNGAGMEEEILASKQNLTATSWSRDGRYLMFNSIDPKTNADIWVASTSDWKSSVFLKTPFREVYGEFSPDGRFVAYHSNESGRPEIYIRPFVPPGGASTAAAAAGGQWQVSTEGGIMAVWRADGRELYYLNPAGAMMAVPIASTGEPGSPAVLFPTHIFGGGGDIQQGRQYDLAADGRFLINAILNEAAAPITLLQNWNPEKKK